MKSVKKKFSVVLAAILTFIVIVWCALSQLSFRKSGVRDQHYALPEEYVAMLDGADISPLTPESIAEYVNGLASKQLTFSYRNDINGGRANCVGYAQFVAAASNYLFARPNIPSRATPVYGTVKLFGVDLCQLSQHILPSKYRSFFRDHDYVEISCGGDTLVIDASLHDVLGWNYIVWNSKK